jgi:hypothetical protein
LEESNRKLKQNDLDEREEVGKKLKLKLVNDDLKEKHESIGLERYRIEKDRERVKQENQARLNVIDELTMKYNEELNKLTDTLNRKLEKLEKILKKKQEKEIDIEEMIVDKRNMEQ